MRGNLTPAQINQRRQAGKARYRQQVNKLIYRHWPEYDDVAAAISTWRHRIGYLKNGLTTEYAIAQAAERGYLIPVREMK